MRKRVAAAMLAAVCLGANWNLGLAAQEGAPAGPRIAVSNLAHKLVEGPDADDDYMISLKVTVKNLTADPQPIDIWVQALDREGFEIFDANLRGTVAPGETRNLSDTRYIAARIYAAVVEWRIED